MNLVRHEAGFSMMGKSVSDKGDVPRDLFPLR